MAVLYFLVALLLFSGVLEVLRLFSWEPSGPARLVCGVVAICLVVPAAVWAYSGIRQSKGR